MSDIQYNLQFENLCNILKLGNLIEEPKAVSGGLLHRMYAVKTTKGKYAIKALNPQIILRSEAMSDYIKSEQIANIVSKNLPALPAKIFNDTSIQKLDNQFYLVFDWAEGRALKPDEINIKHCRKIGALLADIHRTDFSEIEIANGYSDNPQVINWDYYLHKGEDNNAVWTTLLFNVIDKLYYCSEQANKASELLASDMVISHRDLDPKNVMWNNDSPLLIDWESAGYINPAQDLTETAIYWAENEVGNIDKERFLAFVDGYKSRYRVPNADWSLVLSKGFLGKLGWLEYSLKRSLWIECTDGAEQQMGTEQVTGTIEALARYAGMKDELEKWLCNEI
jgi:thiamine kinase-like enzyme